MSLSENSRHQVRKSRQSELPIIKFRSSCDLCTEAKVRCDKKHPQCSRCIRIGSTCRYSVSMRTGKPTIDYVKALNASTLLKPPHRHAQTTVHPVEALDSDRSVRAILQTDQSQSSGSTTKSSVPATSDSGFSLVFIRPPQDQDSSPDLKNGLLDPSPQSTAMPTSQNKIGLQLRQSTDSSSQTLIDVTDYLYMSEDDFNLLGGESQSSGFSPSVPPAMDFDYFPQFNLSEPESPRISQITTLISINQGANESAIILDPALQQPQALLYEHSCLRTLKALQQSFTMMASRDETMQCAHSILASTPPVTTTDQALIICSKISKQLVDILQCRCEADAYLPFLIAVTISKVLATYAAIAKVDDSTPFNFGSVPRLQKEQEQEQEQQQQEHQQQQEDAFVAVPLQLGVYEVDKKLEGVLKAQLVLYELSQLECTVQLFREKYCQGGGADEKEPPSEDGTIYSALGQFIKQRYARTKAACGLKISLPTIGQGILSPGGG